MIEFHTINLKTVQLHYAEAYGPRPALVILHGLTGSHTEFLPVIPKLAKHAHVYALDLRGHGLSSWAAGAYQLADYGRDVVAFLRQVVGKPAVVVGHSLGGLCCGASF
jgi:pimeloyl-ACP methyl ester carboxylesterase